MQNAPEPLHAEPLPGPGSAPANGQGVLTVPSSALLQGRSSVEITHNGATYRLQATRLGKLILTK